MFNFVQSCKRRITDPSVARISSLFQSSPLPALQGCIDRFSREKSWRGKEKPRPFYLAADYHKLKRKRNIYYSTNFETYIYGCSYNNVSLRVHSSPKVYESACITCDFIVGEGYICTRSSGLWKLRTNAPISEGHRRTTNHEEGDGGEPLRAGIISLRPRGVYSQLIFPEILSIIYTCM